MKWDSRNDRRRTNREAPGGVDRRATVQADALLEALSKRIESHEPLSTAEIAILRKVIEAYRGWLLLGGLTKWVLVVLGGITAAAVGIGHLRSGFKLWLGN
mgnify:CR=1 FL=1